MDAAPGPSVHPTMLALVCACVLLSAAAASPRRPAANDVDADDAAVRRLAKVLGFPSEGDTKPHSRASTPRYMLDLYDAVADGRGRARAPLPHGATSVRCLQEHDPSDPHTLRFTAPSVDWSEEQVIDAELHVHVPHGKHHRHQHTPRHVHVYQLQADGVRHQVDSTLVARRGGRHVFHVRSAVPAWLAGAARLSLQLTERTPSGDLRQLPVSRRGHHHNKQPLLVLFSRSNASTEHHHIINEELAREVTPASSLSRLRRSLPDISAGCERHELYIDFAKIGWSEFVVAPRGYDAFHCLGRCEFPLTPEQRPSNHATVQSLAHQMGMSDSVLPPSCVPSTLSSLTVLFNDDDNTVVLKKYTDMVADECGCH